MCDGCEVVSAIANRCVPMTLMVALGVWSDTL